MHARVGIAPAIQEKVTNGELDGAVPPQVTGGPRCPPPAEAGVRPSLCWNGEHVRGTMPRLDRPGPVPSRTRRQHLRQGTVGGKSFRSSLPAVLHGPAAP